MSKHPKKIYAWMGMQDNGSWDKEPCPCCESLEYFRLDIVLEVLSKLLWQRVVTAANDNKVNPDWIEVVRVCRTFRQRYGVDLLPNDGRKLRHRSPRDLANFLWFCKFEERWRQVNNELTRANLRIVSQNA